MQSITANVTMIAPKGVGFEFRLTVPSVFQKTHCGYATAAYRLPRNGCPVAHLTRRRHYHPMDVVWWVIAVLAIFGVVLYSVGQVLLRGPATSGVPKSGGMLMLVGGTMVVTAIVLAIAHVALGLF